MKVTDNIEMTKEELEVLKEYIEKNKLDTPNRKRWKVDQRNYLFKYILSHCLISFVGEFSICCRTWATELGETAL